MEGWEKGLQYIEYGKEHDKVMIFLHGGGLSWWNYRDAAKTLQSEYHVILPILDGHAGSDKNFISIEQNALEIIEFIDKQLNGSVFLIGGLSLGGQILLEILSKRKDICRYAVVESALVKPSKLTYSLIKPTFGGCYGLVKRRWFAKLQFKYLRIKSELFEEYYKATCGIAKQSMIAFLQANALYAMHEDLKNSEAKILIFVGAKENYAMQFSAKKIQERLKRSQLKVLPNMYHGEFSINHGVEYAKTIIDFIDEDRNAF